MISGRSEKSLKEAAMQLRQVSNETDGGLHDVCRGDIQEIDDAKRMISTTVDRFGGVDIVINNAGVGLFGDVADQSVEDWDSVIGTNLSGVFYCCRAAIPYLRERGGGWIINVSSLAGSHPFATGGAYCASKAGLDAFTTALMQDLRFDGIRVSSVAPGSVGTSFAGGSRHAAEPWKLTPTDVARIVVDLLSHDTRSLPSRMEIRPSQPNKS
ncbi:MAG: SDR family NAD(P)-dependent oxidoreductase [Acidobacteriota bacterium]|nr:SDR family NAD(P)-dependent oxidoreductase [Acidobacteriota bacterium]